MNRPTKLYRYRTQNGYISKLYTQSGLKQVIRSQQIYYDLYPTYMPERHDPKKWKIEQIDLDVSKVYTVDQFMDMKLLKTGWLFSIDKCPYERIYVRVNRDSAWEQFVKDMRRDCPDIDLETCVIDEDEVDIDTI